MAEWSKAVDSSPTISGCVGSNPTAVIGPRFMARMRRNWRETPAIRENAERSAANASRRHVENKACRNMDAGRPRSPRAPYSTVRKCRDPGSSRGPSDLQSDALPTELSRLLILRGRSWLKRHNLLRAKSTSALGAQSNSKYHATGSSARPNQPAKKRIW